MHKNVKTIEDNSELVETLRNYVVPEVKYSQVELDDKETGQPFLVTAMETLPLNFDKTRNTRCCFIFMVDQDHKQ